MGPGMCVERQLGGYDRVNEGPVRAGVGVGDTAAPIVFNLLVPGMPAQCFPEPLSCQTTDRVSCCRARLSPAAPPSLPLLVQ